MAVIPDHAEGPKADRPHSVYRIYDASDHLLYVGCAENVEDRLGYHMAWSTQSVTSLEIHRRMSRHTSERFRNLAEAHAAEIRAIKSEAPLLNKQHNPTRFKYEHGSGYIAVA